MKKVSELWEEYHEKDDKKVRCHICAHHCVIAPGKRGFCNTKLNKNGELFSLIYGSLISPGSVDPIEKKPLYHFYPNSNAFSIASIGCNLRCKHCQNWEISKSFPDENGQIAQFCEADQNDLAAHDFNLTKRTPKEVIQAAKRTNSKNIAYTYNEPLIWYDFIKDTAKLAHENGIKNILVTGGYSSKQANEKWVTFIDAANIDIKGFTREFYKEIVGVPNLQPILNTAKYFKENGVHVEITNLIIPKENDKSDEIREMVIWIRDNLGKDTPLHFSAYHPTYRLNRPQTPSSTLKKAWNIAKEEGLHYVFMGNIRTTEGSNTICPHCGAVLIKRMGYSIEKKKLNEDNLCSVCGEKISIIGEFSNTKRHFLF